MRLFIAIELPAEVKDALAAAEKRIPREAAQFSLVRPEHMHLTLKFLGDVKEENVVAIRQALREIRVVPFIVTMSGIGVFPSEHFTRVVWAGLKDGEAIIRLQEQIDNAMAPLGFAKEKDFSPHATLCRVKYVKDKERFVKAIKEITVERVTFTATSFALVQSTLTREGLVYVVAERFGPAG